MISGTDDTTSTASATWIGTANAACSKVFCNTALALLTSALLAVEALPAISVAEKKRSRATFPIAAASQTRTKRSALATAIRRSASERESGTCKYMQAAVTRIVRQSAAAILITTPRCSRWKLFETAIGFLYHQTGLAAAYEPASGLGELIKCPERRLLGLCAGATGPQSGAARQHVEERSGRRALGGGIRRPSGPPPLYSSQSAWSA